MVELRKTFFKSKEGVEAFSKVGLPYENSAWDNDYEMFLRTTKKTSEKDAKAEIQNLLRMILPNGEQWISYDMTETRHDNLGNRKMFYRSNIGLYHIPVPEYKIRMNEDYEKETYTAGYTDIETGYNIPFTAKKADELHKFCTDKTAYLITLGGYKAGRRIGCDSFENWKEGEPLELNRFGHKANAHEKQLMLDEKNGLVHQGHQLTTGRPYS
jgi:hypothetical protein